MLVFKFTGFASPNFTQIPDEAFDFLMPRLSPAEWKVLCYIMRRTFGFKKSSDDISLKQMVEGIQKKDGTVLDEGTGLSKAGVAKCVTSLLAMEIIIAVRNRSREHGDEATTYQLHFAGLTLSTPLTPVSTQLTGGLPQSGQARVYSVDTQDTVEQETVLQETDPDLSKDEPTENLSNRITIITTQLNDEEHLESNITQARRIFMRSGMSEGTFIRDFVDEAYRRAYHQRGVKKPGDKPFTRNRAPYFFAVLRDLLGHKTG